MVAAHNAHLSPLAPGWAQSSCFPLSSTQASHNRWSVLNTQRPPDTSTDHRSILLLSLPSILQVPYKPLPPPPLRQTLLSHQRFRISRPHLTRGPVATPFVAGFRHQAAVVELGAVRTWSGWWEASE